MEIVTIDGMVENDFRLSIEDMLRLDQVDEAIERLRALLGGFAGPGAGSQNILPERFLEVSSADLEIGGWHRLEDRLLDHGRSKFPITAIGVTLADARQLGGPRPDGGRLSPFIKTFYFSDEAYPFSEASRDDLLDGYSRDGFELQGDYSATDATLSVRGIDDLYGAIAELEGRLFDSADPDADEIRAGAIGSCFLAALIHQALRDTIREKGLPRPLCVFAACDGVYPFFDAPVTGSGDCPVVAPAQAASDAMLEAETGDNADADEDEAEDLPGEGSLLTLFVRREAKAPVMVLDAQDAEEAARSNEMAAARRMGVDEGDLLKVTQDFVVLEHAPHEDYGSPEYAQIADDVGADSGLAFGDSAVLDRPAEQTEQRTVAPDPGLEQFDELPAKGPVEDYSPTGSASCDTENLESGNFAEYPEAVAPVDPDISDVPVAAPQAHSLRARIKTAQPDAPVGLGARIMALLARMRRMFP